MRDTCRRTFQVLPSFQHEIDPPDFVASRCMPAPVFGTICPFVVAARKLLGSLNNAFF